MHLLTGDVCDTVGWSPDGTRLALYRSAVYEIYAFRRDGQLGRLLRRLPDTFATAGWTRSGRFVTVERESRLGRVLQNHESHGAFLSPDGRRVVFSSTWACRNRNVRLKNVRLWIGDVTTGRVRRLTRGC
jgi:Tol biopolymer transport system component